MGRLVRWKEGWNQSGVRTVGERQPWGGLEACNVLRVGFTDDGGVPWGVDFG